MFQFSVLPEAAFLNHPELIQELTESPSVMPLSLFQSKALMRCLDAGLIAPSAVFGPMKAAAVKAENELYKSVSIRPHKQNGYTAYVVTMPRPESPPEAHFAAIVYKDDELKQFGQTSPSTRYFTLEHSITPLPVLCELCCDGSRKNHGLGPAPEIAAFVEAIFKQVIGN